MAAPASKRKTKPRTRKAAAPKTAAARRRRAVKEHGTEAGYRAGCRCDECTHAATEARNARKDRKTRTTTLEHLQRELRELQATEPLPGKRAPVDPELYREYVEARAAADAAERDLLHAELALKRAMVAEQADRFTVKGRTVGTWELFTRTFFDTAAFRKAHPALWEKFQRDGGTRRFIVTMFAATPPQRKARAVVRGQRR